MKRFLAVMTVVMVLAAVVGFVVFNGKSNIVQVAEASEVTFTPGNKTLLKNYMQRMQPDSSAINAKLARIRELDAKTEPLRKQLNELNESSQKAADSLMTPERAVVQQEYSLRYTPLKEKFDRLCSEKRMLEDELGAKPLLARLDKAFPRLDMSFLGDKHANGSPKYAVIGLDEESCVVGWVKDRNRPTESPTYSFARSDANRFDSQYSVAKNTGFETTFKGIIPEDVREKVSKVRQASLFNSVALVWETTPEEWTEPRPRSYNRDPLVIGFWREDYNKPDICWVIAEFNMTPAEQWEKRLVKQDPLIIGWLEHKGQRTAWLISRFNTTKLEDWVASEFTTGPEN